MTKKPAKPASKPSRQQAVFETANASRYLQQMLKHFAHKIEVDYTAEVGTATFPFGHAALTADANMLTIVVEGPSARDMVQTRYVVEEHLLRFAFREEPEPLSWRPLPVPTVAET